MDLADGVVMIRVNEGIVVLYTSILSGNQLRNFSTKVNDCLRKSGGRQDLVINNESTWPVQYLSGLSYLPVKKPTKQELDTLPILDISSAMPWNL